MTRRFEGFPTQHGLVVLDTFTGTPVLHPFASMVVDKTSPAGTDQLTVQAGPDAPRIAREPIDTEVVSSFPYPIARAWSTYLEEPDPRLRCKHLVDTFTALLKYWALITASEYLNSEVQSPAVNRSLVRDIKRPLISTWNLLLDRAISAMRDADLEPFAPEAWASYDALERKCRDKVLVDHHFVDTDGTTKRRTKKLGQLQALIQFRNRLAHGFNLSKDVASADDAFYANVLRRVFRQMRWLTRYELWHVRRRKKGMEGQRLHGARPERAERRPPVAQVTTDQANLFLLNESRGLSLPLFAFLDVDGSVDGRPPNLEWDLLLFEGETKKGLVYVSAGGVHLEKVQGLAHWKKLLAEKAVGVQELNTASLSHESVALSARRITEQTYETLVESGKVIPDVTVPRPDLEEHLRPFLQSEHTGFVLGGVSGIGKTTLLAQKSNTWMEAGHAVVFYRASALRDANVIGRMLRDMGLRLHYLEEFLELADPHFDRDKRFLLVIDAVNEFAGDLETLLVELEAWVQQASAYPWFQIIYSVREDALHRVSTSAYPGHRDLDAYYRPADQPASEHGPIVHLGPIGPDDVEALYEAYRAYRAIDTHDPDAMGIPYFCPQTPFSELKGQCPTKALLADPMMCRILTRAFHGRALPTDLSDDLVMRLFIENVVERRDEGAGFPERTRFLRALVRELYNARQSSLNREHLYDNPTLAAAQRTKDGRDVYADLMDLGILVEDWNDDRCDVRIAYDRLHEHLLANLIEAQASNEHGFFELFSQSRQVPELRGSLSVVLERTALAGHYAYLADLVDTIDLDDHGPSHDAFDLFTDFLARLGAQGQPSFYMLLNAFLASPTPNDALLLEKLVSHLRTQRRISKECDKAAIKTWATVGRALHDPRSIGLAALADYAICEGEQQKPCLAVALEYLTAEAFPEERSRALSAYGRWWRHHHGDLGKQLQCAEEALALLQEPSTPGARKALVNALLTKASALDALGDIPGAARAAEDASRIDEGSRANRWVGFLYCLLGRLTEGRTLLEQTAAAYEKSGQLLAAASEIQDVVSGVAYACRSLGDVLAARRWHAYANALRKRWGQAPTTPRYLDVDLALDSGQWDEARRLVPLTLDKPCTSPESEGIRRHRLGCVAYHVGDVDLAAGHWQAAAAIRAEMKDLRFEAESLGLTAMTATGTHLHEVAQRLAELSQQVAAPEVMLASRKAHVLRCIDAPSESDPLHSALDELHAYATSLEGTGDVLHGPALVYWAAAKHYHEHQQPVLASRWASLALDVVGERGWREAPLAHAMVNGD